ncbi:uncharacterized protein LOC113521085 [Galleria mellonella]|uniref:Uncharacterized protein LOC113521085 n=1 Tax=Galleria mellonella TaxID=7137 RepID=A0A6J3BSI7_GALME|nr:uncharacterized protein LOC113521085 [Galleria mellonella]
MAHVLHECQCSMMAYPTPPDVVRCPPELLECAKFASVSLNIDQCDCIHTCNVDKEYPIYTTNDLMPGSYYHDPFYDDLDLTKVSIVRVYILKRKINSNERHAYFGQTDLFSQLGGAFNLFFGCSILSLLEILQLFWYCFKNWYSGTKDPKSGVPTKAKRNSKKIRIMKNKKDKSKKKVMFSL